ncbi:hypothetical protein OUZ56_021149 [Daphnia magna]|uniref:Uncharacterized protein n=1 Tax=Daphnia magna TaxID=35525 RepID=A0ABQ9ZGJ7_9CRUS|nr:hypothetical protein OUZ56_021149 [Daphnia magna]
MKASRRLGKLVRRETWTAHNWVVVLKKFLVWGSMLIVTSEFMQDVVAIKSIFVKGDETGIFLNDFAVFADQTHERRSPVADEQRMVRARIQQEEFEIFALKERGSFCGAIAGRERKRPIAAEN